MNIRMTLAALALAAPMMIAPTASQAGGLHHMSLCPLDLLSHMRGHVERPAKAERKAAKPAAKKVAAKAAPKKAAAPKK